MRLIKIENQIGETIAVNAINITTVKAIRGTVLICLSGGSTISTKFTSIPAAVDYIQRAPSMSMGVS